MKISQKVCFIFIIILSLIFYLNHEIGTQTTDEKTAKLIEGAKKEAKMVWYTSMSVDDSTPMLERFEKKYPFIKTELYRASAEKILTKILAEVRAGKYLFDVVSASGFETQILKKQGIIGKYISPESMVFKEGFKDPEGYWTDTYINTYVLGYNTKLVAPSDVPKKYEDLLDPKWKGKIAIDREEYEWYANMMFIMGEKKGLDLMRRLAKQDLILQKGHTLITQLLVSGEFPIALIVYGHRVEEFKAKKAPIEWVPIEPVIVNLHPIAIASKAANPNSAKLFIDFILSQEGQKIIQGLGRIPSRPDVEPIPARLTKGIKLWPSRPELGENYSKYVKEFNDIFIKKK